MLILPRKPGETIRIGGEIDVSVGAFDGNRVCVAVQAPRTVPVHRKEVAERIRRGEAAARQN